MQERGVVIDTDSGVNAVSLGSSSPTEPNFIVIQRGEGSSSRISNPDALATDLELRHEVHHQLWNYATRAEMTAESATLDLVAFDEFKNELTGYIISKESLGNLEIEQIISVEPLIKAVS